MSGTKKVLNFAKTCGHSKPHFGCRSCIAAAEPTRGNVAQTGRNIAENERMMEVFIQEDRRHQGGRTNEANAKRLREQQKAAKAQGIADTMRAASCGHKSLSFGCSDCEASLRAYRRALRRSVKDLDR